MKDLEKVLKKCFKRKINIFCKYWTIKIWHLYYYEIDNTIVYLVDNTINGIIHEKSEYYIKIDDISYINIIHDKYEKKDIDKFNDIT